MALSVGDGLLGTMRANCLFSAGAAIQHVQDVPVLVIPNSNWMTRVFDMNTPGYEFEVSETFHFWISMFITNNDEVTERIVRAILTAMKSMPKEIETEVLNVVDAFLNNCDISEVAAILTALKEISHEKLDAIYGCCRPFLRELGCAKGRTGQLITILGKYGSSSPQIIEWISKTKILKLFEEIDEFEQLFTALVNVEIKRLKEVISAVNSVLDKGLNGADLPHIISAVSQFAPDDCKSGLSVVPYDKCGEGELPLVVSAVAGLYSIQRRAIMSQLNPLLQSCKGGREIAAILNGIAIVHPRDKQMEVVRMLKSQLTVVNATRLMGIVSRFPPNRLVERVKWLSNHPEDLDLVMTGIESSERREVRVGCYAYKWLVENEFIEDSELIIKGLLLVTESIVMPCLDAFVKASCEVSAWELKEFNRHRDQLLPADVGNFATMNLSLLKEEDQPALLESVVPFIAHCNHARQVAHLITLIGCLRPKYRAGILKTFDFLKRDIPCLIETLEKVGQSSKEVQEGLADPSCRKIACTAIQKLQQAKGQAEQVEPDWISLSGICLSRPEQARLVCSLGKLSSERRNQIIRLVNWFSIQSDVVDRHPRERSQLVSAALQQLLDYKGASQTAGAFKNSLIQRYNQKNYVRIFCAVAGLTRKVRQNVVTTVQSFAPTMQDFSEMIEAVTVVPRDSQLKMLQTIKATLSKSPNPSLIIQIMHYYTVAYHIAPTNPLHIGFVNASKGMEVRAKEAEERIFQEYIDGLEQRLWELVNKQGMAFLDATMQQALQRVELAPDSKEFHGHLMQELSERKQRALNNFKVQLRDLHKEQERWVTKTRLQLQSREQEYRTLRSMFEKLFLLSLSDEQQLWARAVMDGLDKKSRKFSYKFFEFIRIPTDQSQINEWVNILRTIPVDERVSYFAQVKKHLKRTLEFPELVALMKWSRRNKRAFACAKGLQTYGFIIDEIAIEVLVDLKNPYLVLHKLKQLKLPVAGPLIERLLKEEDAVALYNEVRELDQLDAFKTLKTEADLRFHLEHLLDSSSGSSNVPSDVRVDEPSASCTSSRPINGEVAEAPTTEAEHPVQEVAPEVVDKAFIHSIVEEIIAKVVETPTTEAEHPVQEVAAEENDMVATIERWIKASSSSVDGRLPHEVAEALIAISGLKAPDELKVSAASTVRSEEFVDALSSFLE